MKTRSPKKGLFMKVPASTKEPKRTLCAEPIKSWPAKERPRERLLADGPARLSLWKKGGPDLRHARGFTAIMVADTT